MKSLIHKPLSLITKTRIRGIYAFRGEKRERERCVGADRDERSRVADRRPSSAGWDGGEEKEGGYGRRKKMGQRLKSDIRATETLGGD